MGAMAVALQLKPQPLGEGWFMTLRMRMSELQKMVR